MGRPGDRRGRDHPRRARRLVRLRLALSPERAAAPRVRVYQGAEPALVNYTLGSVMITCCSWRTTWLASLEHAGRAVAPLVVGSSFGAERRSFPGWWQWRGGQGGALAHRSPGRAGRGVRPPHSALAPGRAWLGYGGWGQCRGGQEGALAL